MSYGDTLLAQGEKIVYRDRQHWLAPLSDSLRPIVLVLLGLSVVSGWVLPWTYIIAVILILIGIGFIARGFGRMW